MTKVTQTMGKQTQTTPYVGPKCASAKAQLAKPTAKMLQYIASKGTHPGKALRIKRWHKYKVGQTLLHCKVTPGLDYLDVLFYQAHGLVTLAQPSNAQVQAAQSRWAKAQPQAAGNKAGSGNAGHAGKPASAASSAAKGKQPTSAASSASKAGKPASAASVPATPA